MTVKNKVCSCGCGKSGKIWSKGMLKQCFFRLNSSKPIKKNSKSLKKSFLSKKPTEKQIQKNIEKKEYNLLQWELFEKHWNLKPHYCESCNKYLGSENNLCFHDHLIEKSSRRDIALEIENLYLCCFDCHNLKTNGFPTENHKKAIKIAKEKYGL